MEGRRRLFGRAIAAIDRRPSRRSGLAPNLPNGAAAGAIDVSSSEEDGGAPASRPYAEGLGDRSPNPPG